jgi:restriction endonuclease
MEELAQYILENKPATTSAEEALQLILLAAQVSGNASCMIRAGDYLRDGIGGPVDLAEAANWYRKAAECEQMLFKNEELVNYLSAVKVSKSVYEYVVYDSDVERKFAEQLDQREDIKLFVKLPGWFEIDTPIGKYNPDWAILKHDGQALYLVRETKGTRDFLKLRTSEADKVNCGKRHFEAIGVDFAVAVTVEEV